MRDKKRNMGRHNYSFRAAAALLALGLGAGSLCAAAEAPAQLREGFPVQLAEEPEAGTETDVSGAEADMQAEEQVVAEELPEALPEDASDTESVEDPVETDVEIILEEIEMAEPETSAGEVPADSGDGTLLPNAGLSGADGAQQADSEAQAEDSLAGECGAQPGTVYWSLDGDGVLTVEGNGPMISWDSVEQTPWYGHLADLRKIVIAEGVTSVGAHAFCGAQTVGAVELAESVGCVGAFAFFQCGGFGTVSIG